MRLKARRPGARHAGPSAIDLDELVTVEAVYGAMEGLEEECTDTVRLCAGCTARTDLASDLGRRLFEVIWADDAGIVPRRFSATR